MLSDVVDLKVVVLIEFLVCCVYVVLEKIVVKKEDKVLIFGLGFIGLL